MGAGIADFGTNWKNVLGTRDQMIKFGWDQGPNGKNCLGPGTIGPPHAESQCWHTGLPPVYFICCFHYVTVKWFIFGEWFHFATVVTSHVTCDVS